MKRFLFVAVFFTTASIAAAQQPAASRSSSPDADTLIFDRGMEIPMDRRSDRVGLIPVKDDYVRPDAATRRKRFINSTVGPFALARMAASAGISTWRNSPEEWGTKWEGFGRRFASSFGRNAIKQTTKAGLDEALKYDSHFYRDDKTSSFGRRFRRALLSPVTARDKNGKRVVGIPNLVGTYTASIVAYEAWYPNRYSWKDGVRGGTISLGYTAAFNLFKEFVWRK